MDPSASPNLQVSAVGFRSVMAVLALALATFALLSTAPTANAESDGPSVDIINGTVVPNSPTEWPFIVALLESPSNGATQFCGGSLIKANWVLTAAHCVHTPSGGRTVGGVLYGRKNLTGVGGQVLGVSDVFVHADYNPSVISNDIALIKLSSTPTIPTTITTATPSEDPAVGTTLDAAGWGATTADGSSYPLDLYEANINTVSNTSCAISWGPGLIFPTSLCGSASPSDTCFGDSGGPLVHNTVNGPRLVGIVSWGSDPCNQVSFPGVYSRVSGFQAWIAGFLGKSIAPTAAQVDFGALPVGAPATKQSINFTSTGEDPVTVGAAAITSGSDFSVVGGNCVGATLPSGSACQMEVAYSPTATGSRTGELTLTTDGSGSTTAKVALFGRTSGQPIADVQLALKMLRKSKPSKKRGKIRADMNVSYRVPPGTVPAAVCTGTVRLSLKIPGYRRAFVKGGQVLWGPSGCSTKLIFSLPKRAKGKRATATATLVNNVAARATTLTVKQKIR